MVFMLVSVLFCQERKVKRGKRGARTLFKCEASELDEIVVALYTEAVYL